jgi:heme-degrading monooxygenase HmoA
MISRQWRGLARPSRAGEYIEHLRKETFPQLRGIEGFVDATILQRRVGPGVEFLVVTRWVSPDAIRKFAGENVVSAVVPAEVQAMMIEYDTTVRHYDIVE